MTTGTSRSQNAEEGYPTEASFALKSDDLNPAKITAALGIEPTRAWKKGDQFENLSGVHTRASGIWRLATGRSVISEDLGTHIESLLGHLEPRKDALLRLVDEMSALAIVNLWWNAKSFY